jgi:hypothetical protein
MGIETYLTLRWMDDSTWLLDVAISLHRGRRTKSNSYLIPGALGDDDCGVV